MTRRTGLTLSSLLLGVSMSLALDADGLLNYTWGRFGLRPQFDAASMFTDNVFYGNDGILQQQIYKPILGFVDSGTGLVPVFGPVMTNSFVARSQESDVVMTASPGLKMEYGLSGGNQLSLEFGYDQIFFLDHPQSDTQQERLDFKAIIEKSRLRFAGNSQIYYLSSFLGGGQFIRGTLVNRRVWSDNYTLTYDSSAKTDVYANIYNTEVDYDRGLNIFDFNSWRGSLGASYKITERIAIFSEGHYGQSAINPNIPSQVKGPHSDVYGGFIGARGDFTAKLNGSLKVGYETREFPGSVVAAAGTSSPAVKLTLTYSPRLKTQIVLDYDRRTDISANFGSQAYTFDVASLTIRQLIGSSGKWLAQLRGEVSMADFGDVATRVPILDTDSNGGLRFDPFGNAIYKNIPANAGRSDTTMTLGAGLSYQPRPWLTGSLFYEYENYSVSFRDSQYAAIHPLIPYGNNRVSLRVSIGF